MKGRLNLFQAAMLRWRELHPYSAIHVVRIDRALDAARLGSIIDGELEARGLTGLVLDARRGRFEYTGGPARTRVAVHAGGVEPMRTLERVMGSELNVAFARDGPLDPFRFFGIEGGAGFHLGVTYDHVIAGGDSIVVLMRGIHARYCGDDGPAPPSPRFERYPPTYRRLLLGRAAAVARGLPHLPEMAASCRRGHRPAYPRGDDPANAFAVCRIDAAEFSALVSAASGWGVTVNDLLMAILLVALDPLSGERSPVQPRHELGIASIINLRREFGIDPGVTFGQFLSSFRVSHPMPRGIGLAALARAIHLQTERVKREKTYLQSLVAIAASGVLWRLLTPERRARFYAKNYPVAGAISMLDVDALWAIAGAREAPPEYLRAVPTGPLAPVVVAATTAGGVLHLGFSYRTAAFSTEEIGRLAAGMLGCVRSLGA